MKINLVLHYESGYVKGFKIFDDSIQLELNTLKRKTFPVKIENLEERCFLKSLDLKNVKTEFNIFDLKDGWTDVSWSELLFHN